MSEIVSDCINIQSMFNIIAVKLPFYFSTCGILVYLDFPFEQVLTPECVF